MRPQSPFKTPPISRGNSPARAAKSPVKPSPTKASPSRQSRQGASPNRTNLRKPGSSPNIARRNGFSPDRSVKRISPPPTRSQSERNLRTRGLSPSSRGTLNSRGSE